VLCQSDKSPYLTTKCCTYFPALPNYLVGGVLSEPDHDEGRLRMLAVISQGHGVTPRGVQRSKAWVDLRAGVRGVIPSRDEAEQQRCPYFEAGQCTVWSHREHECSTYFCYSTAGDTGKAFWQSLRQYLRFVERRLADYALDRLGWDEPAGGMDSSDATPAGWREWAGREVELFIACRRIVADADASTLREWLGREREGHHQRLISALAEFQGATVPAQLVCAEGLSIAFEGSVARILIHGDPRLEVPSLVGRFIRQFDGSRTTDAVVRLAASVNVDVAKHLPDLRAAGVLRAP